MSPDAAALPYRPCAGVVLINSAGDIFAGERRGVPGGWQMPQGGIDPGETPREAALRELAEEISVPESAVEFLAETPDWVRYDLPEELIGKAFKGKFRGQIQHWVLLRLTGPDSLIDLETEHPEFDAWTWMPADKLISAIVPFKRGVYEQIFAIFADHLHRSSNDA